MLIKQKLRASTALVAIGLATLFFVYQIQLDKIAQFNQQQHTINQLNSQIMSLRLLEKNFLASGLKVDATAFTKKVASIDPIIGRINRILSSTRCPDTADTNSNAGCECL